MLDMAILETQIFKHFWESMPPDPLRKSCPQCSWCPPPPPTPIYCNWVVQYPRKEKGGGDSQKKKIDKEALGFKMLRISFLIFALLIRMFLRNILTLFCEGSRKPFSHFLVFEVKLYLEKCYKF